MFSNVAPQEIPISSSKGTLECISQFCRKNNLDLLEVLKNIGEGNNVVEIDNKYYQLLVFQNGETRLNVWKKPERLIIKAYKESFEDVARFFEQDCTFKCMGQDRGIPYSQTFPYIQEKFMNYFKLKISPNDFDEIINSVGEYQSWLLYYENTCDKYLISICQAEKKFSVLIGQFTKVVQYLPDYQVKKKSNRLPYIINW